MSESTKITPHQFFVRVCGAIVSGKDAIYMDYGKINSIGFESSESGAFLYVRDSFLNRQVCYGGRLILGDREYVIFEEGFKKGEKVRLWFGEREEEDQPQDKDPEYTPVTADAFWEMLHDGKDLYFINGGMKASIIRPLTNNRVYVLNENSASGASRRESVMIEAGDRYMYQGEYYEIVSEPELISISSKKFTDLIENGDDVEIWVDEVEDYVWVLDIEANDRGACFPAMIIDHIGNRFEVIPYTRFRYKDQEYLITEDDHDDYPDRIKEGWLSPAGLKVTDEPKTANPQHSISVSDFVKMVADSVSEGVSDITRLSGQTSKTAKVSWATSAVKGTFATQNTIYVVAGTDSYTEKWLVEPGDEYEFKGKTYVIEEGKEEFPEYISQQFIDAALEAETHYDPGPRWQNAVEMPAMDQWQLEALLSPLELPLDIWVKDTGEWDNYALTAVAKLDCDLHLNVEANCNGFWWEVEEGDEFVFNGIHVIISE
jgi:hypothetical protein